MELLVRALADHPKEVDVVPRCLSILADALALRGEESFRTAFAVAGGIDALIPILHAGMLPTKVLDEVVPLFQLLRNEVLQHGWIAWGFETHRLYCSAARSVVEVVLRSVLLRPDGSPAYPESPLWMLPKELVLEIVAQMAPLIQHHAVETAPSWNAFVREEVQCLPPLPELALDAPPAPDDEVID
eukprot:TRINITY_DN5514_c0_g1_i1.p2 TRINITY_DN5514_c0_g1~~TRINITY_DN5514_c0_g1_i1.p2  ORF type:complete len:186 (-),score=65.11 TRINITY_DN5514_c0_g1_i1:47-604(-)